jgi:AsmA family protein
LPRWIYAFLLVMFSLVVLLIAVGWIALAAPFFSEFRQVRVANVLTEQLGHPVEILGDVSVSPGRVSKIFAADVLIMSDNIDDMVFAKLDRLDLELDVIALLDGYIDLDNIIVDGLQVNALKLKDGTTSWNKPHPHSNADIDVESVVEPNLASAAVGEGNILAFLRHKTASFSDIGLFIENRETGFVFDFKLTQFILEQLDAGNRLDVNGFGTVNGQEFQIEGDYPTGASFSTKASFGDLIVTFEGEPIPQGQGGGFWGNLELDTGSFADFLEVLQLNRVLDGSGQLTTKVTSQPGILRITNLASVIDLDEGQQYEINGEIENLLTQSGVDVIFTARLHPEHRPPENAKALRDVVLTKISGHVVSDAHGLEFDELLLATNAFKQGLEEVGPVSIGRLYRTPEGTLAMQNIELQAGPLGAPYIEATGNIYNLLELEQLDVSGKLAVPADLVLDNLPQDVVEAFGGVEADFAVDDTQGFLSLKYLDVSTVNTGVWALKAQMEVGDVERLGGIALAFDLDIADGAYFLKTLQLKEIDTGPLELSASVRGEGTDLTTQFGLAAGASRIDTFIDVALKESRHVIAGQIFSERLNVDDIKVAVAGAVELSRLASDNEAENVLEKDYELQPLVLPKVDEAPAEKYVDGLELQPLILPKAEPKLVDLFDLDSLLLNTELGIAIDIKKITGQQGVSSVSSELSSTGGRAKLGPIGVSYGTGNISIGASIDMLKSPELVSVSGTTNGWDFGNILDEIGLGIKAHGKLSGKFNLTGNRASVRSFVNSMFGSASINMSDGNIASSLLELAGLGIFPWLFSNELKSGYTDIVCISAPIKVNAGKVSSDRAVLETKSVQMVARGHADWRKDSIAIRAEGRPVGKPLSRSAWPFDVVGKLTHPEFKVQVGGSRSKRADGASKMPAKRKPCVPDIFQLE